jgi:hypothetical protein
MSATAKQTIAFLTHPTQQGGMYVAQFRSAPHLDRPLPMFQNITQKARLLPLQRRRKT